MIKSREELLALSADWSARAKNDLRNQLLQFMQGMRTNEEELAYALGMSVGELQQILQGNGEITLTTFSKLLIATNHVLEIKPAEMSPMSYGRRPNGGAMPMPPMGGMPMPNQGRRPIGRPSQRPMKRPSNGRGNLPPMPPMGNGMMPPPPMGGMPNGGMPPMPPMGDFERFGGMPGMSRRPQMPPMPQAPSWGEDVGMNGDNFESMSRPELVSIIQSNFWDSEIDVHRANRETLVDFLNTKYGCVETPNLQTRSTRPQVVNETARTEQPRAVRPVQAEAVSPSDTFMAMLNDELEKNPHLMEQISKFMPKHMG